MYHSLLLLLATVIACDKETSFPLRTDAVPAGWKAKQINGGLPYRWEKGTVHVLAWEETEEKGDDVPYKLTQALVLKRFDQPTEKGQYRWVLAHLYHSPKDKDRPWYKDMLYIPPILPGKVTLQPREAIFSGSGGNRPVVA